MSKLSLTEANEKVELATKLINKYLEETDRDDLCDEGKELYDQALKFVGKQRKIETSVSFDVSNEWIEFELDPDTDETDTYNYVVVLYYNDTEIWRGRPDNISF